MSIVLIAAGFLSLFTTLGHIAMGGKMFLKPILDSNAPEIPRKVFHGLFHLITVNFSLFTFVFLIKGFAVEVGIDLMPIVFFGGASYVLYSVTEVIIALTSGISGALGKMFVWILFLATGTTALIGYFI